MKRYLAAQANRYVLVAQEKHGTRYFDATTEEAAHKSALALLAERFKLKWYYGPGDAPKPPQGLPSADEIKAMPEGKLKHAALQMLNGYRRDCRDYEQAVEDYKDIQAAIKAKDGAKALKILRDRDGEYESVRLEPLED